MSRKLKIAICQHPINSNITSNLKHIIGQIKTAKIKNADIVHFSECNLSSYAGIDFDEVSNQDDDLLKRALQKVQDSARENRIFVIIGSHYTANKNDKPYNSLFLINDKGEIEKRYDKRFLAGLKNEQDNYHYKRGDQQIIFNFKGVKCGLLICHEWRYTELYREYKFQGTELIFQSFYDGKLSKEEYIKEGIEQGKLVEGTMKGNAANNYMWISISNTPEKESCFPSMLIKPNGYIAAKLRRNQSGVLIYEIDFDEKFEDQSFLGRQNAKKIYYK